MLQTGPESLPCTFEACQHPLCNICELFSDPPEVNEKQLEKDKEQKDDGELFKNVLDSFETMIERAQYTDRLFDRVEMILDDDRPS